MSILLTDVYNDTFEWNGEIYKVDMSFDNILRLYEMFDDDILLSEEKPFIAIQMMMSNSIKFGSIDEGIKLFKFLAKEFLDIDVDDTEESDSVKVFDFKKDAELIFASFYSEYKMDLFEMHGKLHWKKFIALFNNLSDESRFKQIVEIRTMKVPSTEESTQEYRDHIIKMKEQYSLDDRTTEEKITSVLDNFATMLK